MGCARGGPEINCPRAGSGVLNEFKSLMNRWNLSVYAVPVARKRRRHVIFKIVTVLFQQNLLQTGGGPSLSRLRSQFSHLGRARGQLWARARRAALWRSAAS